MVEWTRIVGMNEPSCIHRVRSGAVVCPVKPPMSHATYGAPARPQLRTMLGVTAISATAASPPHLAFVLKKIVSADGNQGSSFDQPHKMLNGASPRQQTDAILTGLLAELRGQIDDIKGSRQGGSEATKEPRNKLVALRTEIKALYEEKNGINNVKITPDPESVDIIETQEALVPRENHCVKIL